MAAANIAVLSSFDAKGIEAAQRDLDKLKAASTAASSTMMDGFKKASDKMMDVGKSLTMGVTLPIVGMGVVAGKWASDAAESANKVDVVFAEQAATIRAWAKDSERAFGLSEGQANSFFGSVGTMLKGFGIDMGVVPEMSKSILTLASDLGSFHNIDTATVMDMISASFRGEYDSIQRVIPTINAAAVETKALAMTGKVAKDSLTAQEKALATYQLMLEGAGPAAGDFARTQDGAANSTRIAMAQIRSAGETIGSVFLPIVSKVAGKIAEWADKFSALDKGTQQIIIIVAGVAAALGPLLIGLGAVSKAIIAVNAAMTFLSANPVVLAITAIVVAIAALVAGVIYAYNNIDWFRNAVDTAWDVIQKAVSDAWNNVIKPVWDAIYWYIENILIPYYKILWEIVKAAFENISERIMWAWNTVIKPVWDAIYWYITTILIPYFKMIWEIVSTVFNAVGSIISFVWGNVISPAFERIKSGISTVINIFSTIKDGVSSAFSGVFDLIVEPIKNAINWVIDKWNGLEFTTPNIPGTNFGGVTIGTPDIPRFANGGIFQAPTPGGAGLALLHDGEMILNARQQQQMLAGGDVNVYVTKSDASPYDIGRQLVWDLKVTR